MTRLSEADKVELRAYIVDQINESESRHSVKLAAQQSSQSVKLIADAVAEAIKPLMEEISGLRSLLEETRTQNETLNNKLFEKNANILDLEQSVVSLTQRNVALRSLILEKSDESEQYSRKDCLRISGIPYNSEEDNDSLQQSVIATLNENGVSINENDIHRLHRSSKPQPMNNYKKYLNKVNKKQSPIDPDDNAETCEVIIRFTKWAPRARVYSLHYRKDLAIKVKCDITKYRQELLKDVRTYLADNNLKAYCYVTAEAQLCLKNVATSKKSFFANFADFQIIAVSLVVDPRFHTA